jgi:predicted dienelactone hydrolase
MPPIAPPTTQFRPIPVHVFYPVDSDDISPATPEATYPLDMIYRPADPLFQTVSSEWEAQGIDRAYQSPPPSSNGPFPLVMFSPGWGNGAWAVFYIGTRLASHGIAVAIVYHYGDRSWPHEPPRDHLATALMNRPLDLSFTLTHLLDRNGTRGDLLFGLIDPDRIAASGWSLGGYAAMALAGGDDMICDKPIELGFPNPPGDTCTPSFVDPRIRAIVALDGSNQALYFHELARITIPSMGIGQEWSTLFAGGQGMESWQARFHAACQGHPAYRVDVQGAYHVTFSNRCEALPILLAHGLITEAAYDAMKVAFCGAPLATSVAHRLVTKYMIAFLKDNLAFEAGYQPVLTPGHALRFDSMIEFFVTEKRNAHAIDEDWPGYYAYFMHQPGSEHAKAYKEPRVPIAYFGYGEEN